MNARRCLRVFAYLLWRAFQVMVVIPASLAGGLWLMAALTGQAPTHTVLTALYGAAEIDVRPAAPGHVFQKKCLDPQRATPESVPPPLECERSVREQVPVEEAIEQATATLTQVYTVLVMLSFGALVFFSAPGRRFVGLPDSNSRLA